MNDKYEFVGTITKSGDYGEKRKTQFNKGKKCASTIRTTIMSEGGELIVFMEGGCPALKFKSSHGIVEGYEGECCSLTFAKKDNVHTPVMRGGCQKQ